MNNGSVVLVYWLSVVLVCGLSAVLVCGLSMIVVVGGALTRGWSETSNNISAELLSGKETWGWGLLVSVFPLREVVRSWMTLDSCKISCWVWGDSCVASTEVLLSVSLVLVVVVTLPVVISDCISGVATLPWACYKVAVVLQFEHEVTVVLHLKCKVAAVLWVDRHLVSGGWVVLPFFRFGMTTYDTGQLSKLTQSYVTTYTYWTIIMYKMQIILPGVSRCKLFLDIL